MPSRYNLLHEAWIPVALLDGRRVFVRPCDISELHDGQPVVRIATGRPDCDISLTEFLIGILAVTIGPESTKDWLKRYRKPPARDDLERAFAQLEPAMMLNGPGPRFFQDIEHLEGATTEIAALFMDVPAAHFVKPGRTGVLSRAGAAIALATLQTSAPAGGAGHRTSLRGGGPLSTLVVPGTVDAREPTLWQRLWANVPSGVASITVATPAVFPWLGPTRVSDKSGAATTPADVAPAQAFFGLPRRIRMEFVDNADGRACDLLGIVDEIVTTGYVTRPWGTNYTGWSRGHPLSPYYRQKESDGEFLPLHMRSSRVGYRQWLGMSLEGQSGLRVPARCVDEFRRRAEDFEGEEAVIRHEALLLVAGYAMDNMKPLDFGEALLPLIVTGSKGGDEIVRERAQQWIAAAELIANQLVSSVKRALYGQRGNADPGSTVLDPVRDRFWGETEQAFYGELRILADVVEQRRENLVEHVDGLRIASGERWRAALHIAALRIFDAKVSIEDAESHRIADVIEGRKNLLRSLTGFGPVGAKVFEALALPTAELKKKATRKGKAA